MFLSRTISQIEGDNYKILPPRVFNVPAKKNFVEFSEFCNGGEAQSTRTMPQAER